jgi:hypothetical protein
MTEERVMELVRTELKKHQPGGVSLDVIEGEAQRRDDFWWVGVRPSAQPPKMYEYYEALAEVEASLEENEHLQVQLVPTLPDESDTNAGCKSTQPPRG